MGNGDAKDEPMQLLLTRVAAVEAERDRFIERWAEATRARKFSARWYAERLERLRKLADDNGLTNEHCQIVANGTLYHERPTYAQLMSMAEHRAEKAEEERDQLMAKVRELELEARRRQEGGMG